MAVTQQDVQNAQNARSAAASALQEAQVQLENTPLEEFAIRQQLTDRIKRLEGEAKAAQDEFERVSRAFTDENKPKTPQTPGQAADDKIKEAEADQKLKNAAETGRLETNEERAKREQSEAPKPMTAAQQATANQAAATLRQRQLEAAARQQQAQVTAQQQAIKNAADVTTTVRGQTSTEARERFEGETKVYENSRVAAGAVVEAQTNRRRQEIDIAKSQVEIGQSVLTTAMPKIVELMMNTPKGSSVPRQFAKAMLAIADLIVEKSGLKNIPLLDENSPEMRRLKEMAQVGAGQPPPKFPSSDQISWQATKQLAGMGMPPPGYNGPIGAAAFDLPDMPEGTNGNGENPTREAQQSAEGAAIATEIQGRVRHIEEKAARGEQLTPEEQAQMSAARQEYNARIKQLADQRRTAKVTATPTTQTQDSIKQEVRKAIVTGSPDQKLKIMALASTALANRAAGKPLSPEEIAVIYNLDQADLDIIQRTYNPQMQALIQKQQSGQQLTPQEYAVVQNGVNVMTQELVQRSPVTPTAPTPLAGPPQSTTTSTATTTPPPPTTTAPPATERDAMIAEVRQEFQDAGLGNASDESAIAIEADIRLQQGRKPKSKHFLERMEPTGAATPPEMPKLIVPPEPPVQEFGKIVPTTMPESLFPYDAQPNSLDQDLKDKIQTTAPMPLSPWEQEEEEKKKRQGFLFNANPFGGF